MAKIDTYGRERLRRYEKGLAKKLIRSVEADSRLSKEFKDNLEISVSAKYQEPTIDIPITSERDAGHFEYDILGPWAEENYIDWHWGREYTDVDGLLMQQVFWTAD